MTDLCYIKRNDLLRSETLKCPAIVLKFSKKKKRCSEISLLPAGTPAILGGRLSGQSNFC